MWLLLRANSLAIGGWMQIGAKEWFEREFKCERFSEFVAWTKKRNVQIVAMIINLALIGACLVITFMHGGVGFEFSPFFLDCSYLKTSCGKAAAKNKDILKNYQVNSRQIAVRRNYAAR